MGQRIGELFSIVHGRGEAERDAKPGSLDPTHHQMVTQGLVEHVGLTEVADLLVWPLLLETRSGTTTIRAAPVAFSRLARS